MDAAVGFGSPSGRLGDRAHLRGGVDRIKDEFGGSGGWVGERGYDEGALGAEGLEEGVHDGFRAAIHEADAAEGAVDHEEVAGADTEGDQIADKVGKAQRCAAAGSACFAVRRPWHGSLLVFANQPGWQADS